MNTFAKSLLSLALGLGLSTSAFAQSGPAPKSPATSDVSKAAPAGSAVKVHDAKTPAKKSADSAAVKPAEVKKSESGTAHTTAKDLSKHETPAKPVK
jgi:hypothetical protein